MKLRLTLPIRTGESPQSFVSRLAARHLVFADRFCADMGATLLGIANGRREDLALVADFADLPLERLALDAMVQHDGCWLMRGQKLIKPSIRRDRMMYCAGCLRADVETWDLPPNQAAYGRSVWMVASVRTCVVHGIALSVEERPERHIAGHDFAFRCKPLLSRLDGLEANAVRRPPSAFELYLLGRLAGHMGDAWLDALEFHVAARTCEIVGSVALLGRSPNYKALSDDDWYRCGVTGFDICRAGTPALRSFLDDMAQSYAWGPSGNDGAQSVFGKLYSWLAYNAKSPDFDPVRDVVRSHILDTVPVAAGTEVFGAVVERRRIHSIRSIAKETKKDPRRVRKILANAGLLPADHVGKIDAAVHVDAVTANEALSPLERLRLSEVADYLNMPLRHVETLVRAKRIPAAAHLDERGGVKHRFERAALDEFMERLFVHVKGFAEIGGEVRNIVGASKANHCKVIDVVDLLLEGRLKRVSRLGDVKGVMGLLIDTSEVGSVLRPDLAGVPMRMMKQSFGSSWFAVNALVTEGIIPSRIVKGPGTCDEIRVVSKADFEAFSAKYVTLSAWAKKREMRVSDASSMLNKRGIFPALSREMFRTLIYERAALDI